MGLKQTFQRTSENAPQVTTPRSKEVVERAGNLPASLSDFVGRDAEQAAVGSLVQSSRLVTTVRGRFWTIPSAPIRRFLVATAPVLAQTERLPSDERDFRCGTFAAHRAVGGIT